MLKVCEGHTNKGKFVFSLSWEGMVRTRMTEGNIVQSVCFIESVISKQGWSFFQILCLYSTGKAPVTLTCSFEFCVSALVLFHCQSQLVWIWLICLWMMSHSETLRVTCLLCVYPFISQSAVIVYAWLHLWSLWSGIYRHFPWFFSVCATNAAHVCLVNWLVMIHMYDMNM